MAKGKILIVDDEQAILDLMRMTLELEDYEIVTALDGKEGLEKAKETPPDLIMLDYVMPKIDGKEFIKNVSKASHLKDIPIVLMSGLGEMVYSQKKEQWKWMPNRAVIKQRKELPDYMKWRRSFSNAEVAKKLGVKAYLVKPFSTETLLKTIQDATKKPEEKKS